MHNVKRIAGLADAVEMENDSERPEAVASAVEFILEGLYVNKRLNKAEIEGKTVYRR